MKKIIICTIIGLFLATGSALCIDSIEFFSGYLNAQLKGKRDLEAIPLVVALHWDAKPFIKEKTGIGIKGEFDGIVEPYIHPVFSPDNNVEVGVNFLIRYVLPFGGKIKPYLKGGTGIMYMTQHTREQSTQYNFASQAGGGVSYILNENTRLNAEYRFRHVSNASIKDPNGGIDANIYLLGLEYRF